MTVAFPQVAVFPVQKQPQLSFSTETNHGRKGTFPSESAEQLKQFSNLRESWPPNPKVVSICASPTNLFTLQPQRPLRAFISHQSIGNENSTAATHAHHQRQKSAGNPKAMTLTTGMKAAAKRT